MLHQFDKVLDSLQERKEHLKHHIYLNGNFAPVADEHAGVPVTVVQGEIPRDLDGLFARIGSNPIPEQMSKRYHWFDGHGMLHNLRIQDGKACYSNAYVPTPRYTIEKEFGEQFFNQIGELTGLSGLAKILFINVQKAEAVGGGRNTMGQANTHSIMYQHKFYCCHEASFPFEIVLKDDGSIDKAIGYETFQGVLNFPVSAHPKHDPKTGNLLFHSYTTDPDLIRDEAPIKVGEYCAETNKIQSYLGINHGDTHTPLAHDMMFTENWIVVYDSSVHFDPKQLFVPGGSYFGWTPDYNLRIGLVPRGENVSAAEVLWFDTGQPQSIVHPLSAWEEPDGTVVMWAPIGDKFDDLDKCSNFFYMSEYRMDPKTGSVTMTVIDKENNVEFPRVRDDCLGQFCRFGYSGILDQTLGGEGLVRGFVVWDMLEKKIHKVVNFGKDDIGGEPVVIPKPGTTESNAVFIGTFTYNPKEKTSDFVLYDGETCLEEPVVRLRIPHRVPFGFHGQWVNGTDLRRHVDFHSHT